MNKDKIFDTKKRPIRPFEFNEEVTEVFDDMINRSVPLYQESIVRQSILAFKFYQPGTRIYDMGCSHGNLGIKIHDHFREKNFSMIAVDSSQPMLHKYREKMQTQKNCQKDISDSNGKHAIPSKKNIHLLCGRAEQIKISRASVVIVNLTMQFIHPKKRDTFIRNIYKGLVPGGILLLTEKITHKDPLISDLNLVLYEALKRENGYSELEISQKRDALENVLIPEDLESHEKRLAHAGFRHMDVWLKWFNFASIIAIKIK